MVGLTMDIDTLPSKPDLASRLDAVFGRLGPPAGGTSWSLQQNVPTFKAGKDNLDVYSSDEEAERSAPRPVLPGSLIDSEDDAEDGDGKKASSGEDRRRDERFLSSCTAQYRKAFEAEEEEDEYDRVAVGRQAQPRRKYQTPSDALQVLTEACEPSKPAGSTEVPEDNFLDRLTELRNPTMAAHDSHHDEAHPQLGEGSAVAGTSLAAAVPEVAQAGSSTGRGSMSWAQRMMAEAAAGAAARAAGAAGAAVEAGAAEAAGWEVPTNGAGSKPSSSEQMDGVEGPASEAQHGNHHKRSQASLQEGQQQGTIRSALRQQGSSGRRVRFIDDHEAAAHGGQQGHGRARQQQQQHAAQRQRRGRGGHVQLDWQRRDFVPDHVRNPQRYTVYELDEPLTVGGGGRRRQSAGEEEDAALPNGHPAVHAAGALSQQAVARAGAGEGGADEGLESGARNGQQGQGVEPERVPLAFGSGAVQFRRRGESGGGAGGPGAAVSGSGGSSRVNGSGHPRAVVTMDVDEDDEQQLGLASGQVKSGRRRQFRQRQEEGEK